MYNCQKIYYNSLRRIQAKETMFELLESILWEPPQGYFLLDRHLERLARTADYFNFTLSLTAAEKSLVELSRDLSRDWGTIAQKVRLTVSCDGKLTLQSQTLDNGILKVGALVGIAKLPIDSQNPFLYHKTTYRLPYTMALASQPEYRDVILWNQEGFVTESTIANIAIQTPTGLITPPVKCGLLPGTFRAQLLAEGKIKKELISLDDLRKTQTLFLINSVRGWLRLKQADDRDVWQVVSNDRC